MAEEIAASLDEELVQEVASGHPLYERRCIAIGKREATDVLFAVGAEQVAVVHLAWRQASEPPAWPSTALYASFDDFLSAAPQDFSD